MDAGQKLPEPPKQGVIGTEPTDYEIGSIKDLAFCERGPRDNDSIHQANKAEVYLAIHSAEWTDYNDDEAKAVLHRIDWRLLPLFILTMMLAGMDKIVISNAALYGMTKDTNLEGQQYSWVASIFYFGYMISMYPGNAILQKVPVCKALSCSVILWGASAMLMGATQNFAGLMVLRFIMGCFEAPLFPCVTLLNSMWYTRKEQPSRTAISFAVFSTVGFSKTVREIFITYTGAQIPTGLLSYGIGHTKTGIAPWRLLFIILGTITILWGILLLFYLPDSPLKENFMKGKEKFIALDRVKSNMTGIENRELKWYQVREAFLDYKTYALFLFYLCSNVPLGGLSTFAAQIVSGLGYSNLNTTLLGIPTGIFQTIAGLMVAIPQQWLTNKRCLTSGICCLVPLVCSIVMRKLPYDHKIGRLLSYYFFFFFWGPYATVLTLPMANVSGHTKKLTTNASIFVAYCAAMIIGPQLFLNSEAPYYQTGYNSILGFEIASIACLAIYAGGCIIENRRREKLEGRSVELSVAHMLDDRTDHEKKGFRYVY